MVAAAPKEKFQSGAPTTALSSAGNRIHPSFHVDFEQVSEVVGGSCGTGRIPNSEDVQLLYDLLNLLARFLATPVEALLQNAKSGSSHRSSSLGLGCSYRV